MNVSEGICVFASAIALTLLPPLGSAVEQPFDGLGKASLAETIWAKNNSKSPSSVMDVIAFPNPRKLRIVRLSSRIPLAFLQSRFHLVLQAAHFLQRRAIVAN